MNIKNLIIITSLNMFKFFPNFKLLKDKDLH